MDYLVSDRKGFYLALKRAGLLFFKCKLAFCDYISIIIRVTCLVFSLLFSPVIYTLNVGRASGVLIRGEFKFLKWTSAVMHGNCI